MRRQRPDSALPGDRASAEQPHGPGHSPGSAEWTVSVVVPTHNRVATLGRALASVVAQTVPAGEIIVVDDGSTDATGRLVAERFPDVRYLAQANRGVSAARNRGIRAARNEWIALLDSDDTWLPTKLAEQARMLRERPGHRLCHTEEIWVRNGVRVNPMKKHAKAGGHIFRACLPLCVISPSSALIHRSLFDDVGLFDEALPACEDYDLWLRVCAREPVLFVDTPQIVKHGGHADQLSRRHWGMDRFRVQALRKLLASGRLSGDDRAAAAATLVRKAGILARGAEKRGRREAAETYRRLQSEYGPQAARDAHGRGHSQTAAAPGEAGAVGELPSAGGASPPGSTEPGP